MFGPGRGLWERGKIGYRSGRPVGSQGQEASSNWNRLEENHRQLLAELQGSDLSSDLKIFTEGGNYVGMDHGRRQLALKHPASHTAK